MNKNLKSYNDMPHVKVIYEPSDMVNKKNKPLVFKKWWFWAVIILFIFILIIPLSTTDNKNLDSSTDSKNVLGVTESLNISDSQIIYEENKNTETSSISISSKENNDFEIITKEEEKCEICGIDSWRGAQIPFETHYKDGDHLNNNIQILCPNCHSIQNCNEDKTTIK